MKKYERKTKKKQNILAQSITVKLQIKKYKTCNCKSPQMLAINIDRLLHKYILQIKTADKYLQLNFFFTK